MIRLQNRKLTNADELLLDGKLKEALQEYKANVKKKMIPICTAYA